MRQIQCEMEPNISPLITVRGSESVTNPFTSYNLLVLVKTLDGDNR